eukprot:COSAG02_NODE_5726_length_4092_cov_5.668670_2_plen_66_part_00
MTILVGLMIFGPGSKGRTRIVQEQARTTTLSVAAATPPHNAQRSGAALMQKRSDSDMGTQEINLT